MLPPDLGYLLWPFAACLVLTGIHGYLGIHVLERKVIFVDLALAQIAALGTTVGVLLGLEPRSAGLYLFSLGATLLGAAIFSLTRMRRERIPQEAIIGIVYAVASAGAIVAVDAARDPHGAEHIKGILAGSIVWVTPLEVVKTAALYAFLGAVHFVFRRRFLLVTHDPEEARRQGIDVRRWDFLFYATFGFVITSSVQIAGVLLVFCYLIVPAVIAMLFLEGLRARLLTAWAVGTIISFAGLLFSYDRPSGPVIVCLFGIVLLGAGLVRYVLHAPRRLAALGRIGAGLLATGLLLGFGILAVPGRGEHPAAHEHLGETAAERDAETAPDAAHAAADLGDPDPARRERAVRALARADPSTAVPLLLERVGAETDEGVRLALGRALAALGRPEGARVLVDLLEDSAVVSGGALETLRGLAGGDLGYDPDAADNTAAIARWRRWLEDGAPRAAPGR